MQYTSQRGDAMIGTQWAINLGINHQYFHSVQLLCNRFCTQSHWAQSLSLIIEIHHRNKHLLPKLLLSYRSEEPIIYRVLARQAKPVE
jgi:hypothetical protein